MSLELRTHLREKAAETSFSGVVSVHFDGLRHREAFGFRDGPNQLPNTIETRFGTASITKGFTAVGIAQLIEAGEIGFDTTAQSIIGERLGNLHPGITIRHLLGHTSGIGDYLDEETVDDINAFELAVPVQHLLSPLDYIPLIEVKAQKFEPGARFCYSNSGYIVLAMIIELVGDQPYQEFIESAVFAKAGMARSGFFRADRLPENTAVGYLDAGEEWRTNLFKLPIRGGGDGGAYTTVDDLERFWTALLGGGLMKPDIVSEMLTPRLEGGNKGRWHGYGFWLNQDGSTIALIGGDAGVSALSQVSRSGEAGYTVLSNTTAGAWPMIKLLDERFS